MKKFLLYFFASAGIIGLTFKIIVFYQNEKLAAHYWKNCQNVEIGMTLEQAREIIGDLRYASWTQDKKSAEILVYEWKGEVTYSLVYPMLFGGSDTMRIYFDPITLRVTEIFCGE